MDWRCTVSSTAIPRTKGVTMKQSLFTAIDAYLRFKRVPHLLKDPYKNRQLFTCVVNSLSKRLGRDMHKFFNSPLSLRDRRDKFPNVYVTISKLNRRVSKLIDSSTDDYDVIHELEDLGLITHVNKKSIMGD